MSRPEFTFDTTFVVLTVALIIIGLASFLSGALFLFSENSSIFWSTVLRHVGLGLLGGVTGWGVYKLARAKQLARIAPYVAVISFLLTCLVFVPSIGTNLGTVATRWISIGGVSVQPGEFLKIGAVLGMAWWFSTRREFIGTIWGGLIPFWVITGLCGALLLLQPDTDGFVVIFGALAALYFFAHAPWKHIGISFLAVLVVAGGLLYTRPYLRDRLKTFQNSEQDTLGASYQVRQSLIAIGSGGIVGRGYGKGIHKYEYLPEPMSDGLFAVVGEELGLIGTSLIVILFFLWYVRALVLAMRCSSFFSRYAIVGFAHIVVIQAYINIASNIGIFPFSGLPLPFMSQGGTALFVMLVIIGCMASLMSTGYTRTHVQ